MTIGPGSLINGKYRLGRQLGEGGMGSIYEARHEFLGTEVALKFLHPALSSRPHVVARFVQEARVSANIKSPHVVTVIDVDQSPEGLAFLVMELLHGEPLSGRLAREPILPVGLTVSVALQVLLALELAHGLGVVHRDMKPENVFLTDAPGATGATNDGLLVKILDFGIAKLRTLGEVRAQLTRPGVVMGTPEYMAPEQVFAADAVDARADLYALGAMCFEMLAGRRPVQGDDARAIAAQVMSNGAPRLDAVVPGLPPSICDVVAIALSAKPTDRFSSATAMRQALVHAAREAHVPIDAPPAALRSRVGLPAADASGSIAAGVGLGGVGLGVAPPAMLGPGDPVAMASFDAHRVAPRNGEAPRNASPAALPAASSPQLPAAAPYGVNGARVETGTIPPSPPVAIEASSGDAGHTIAAMPSPFAPPYGSVASVAYAGSPGGTDAGLVSPFANDPSFAGTTAPSAAFEVAPPATVTPPSPHLPPSSYDGGGSRGFPWAAVLVGAALVSGLALALVWATHPSGSSAAPPPPVATAEEDDEPKKKKPKAEPDEPVAKPTAEPTVAPTPPPKPAITAKPTATAPPKPSASTPPAPSTTVTVPPVPSTSTTPPIPSTSASVPKPAPTNSTGLPDIIPLPPLPWPIP